MAKIEIKKESLESFSHNKNVCGISQSEVITKRIIAPIDEKNVTSDWIEQIFDDYNYTYTEVKHTHKYCGFIDGELVMCSYTFGTNTLQWWIAIPSYNSETAYNYNERLQRVNSILLERLQEFENDESSLFSYIDNKGYLIYQDFYFKGE